MALSHEEIRNSARGVIRAAGVEGRFPVPVEEIASTLGYQTCSFQPDGSTEDVSGAIHHETKKIFVNAVESPRRHMFTIAHELGHAVLHKADGSKIDFRSNLNDPCDEREQEANRFAAELLMPEETFRLKWDEFKGGVGKIATFFGVSPAATGYRASTLGCFRSW